MVGGAGVEVPVAGWGLLQRHRLEVGSQACRIPAWGANSRAVEGRWGQCPLLHARVDTPALLCAGQQCMRHLLSA